jgi:signal peptidase I
MASLREEAIPPPPEGNGAFWLFSVISVLTPYLILGLILTAAVVLTVISYASMTFATSIRSYSINGSVLNDPYVKTDSKGVMENVLTMSGLTLGPDQYFLMGDNRVVSEDSRCYGPVPLKNFIGKVIFML